MLSERLFRDSSLCVVGNINRDVKTAPLPAGDHLFRDGETSVSFVSETVGGGGANSAFAAASLGARVAFLGKVGADALGDRLERTLIRGGIAAHLSRDRTHPTGTSIALSFDNGNRHFISCLPASRSLELADLRLDLILGYDHLLRSDVWFSEAMLFEGNRELFQNARKSGVAVSLDLNWDPAWGRAGAAEIRARKQAVRVVLPWVSLAHGNVRELNEFTDSTDLSIALERLADWGVEAVVVHLGAQGAGYYQQKLLVTEPPAPVNTLVNATGTGDVLSVCMMLLHRQVDVAVPERLCLANRTVGHFMEGRRRLIPAVAD